MKLYALHEEVSDQYGTSKLVGIYDSEEKASENESKTRRNFVEEFDLNAKSVSEADYSYYRRSR